MKAVRIHEYGNEDVLRIEEIPVPSINNDDVLIKIPATSVDPVDWKVREGYMKARNIHTLPYILGWDISGTVEQAGSEVTGLKKGDEVFGRSAFQRNGTYAEYIAVKADEVTTKPKNLTHKEAASIPLVGITAWESLVNKAGITKGQHVLIHAASGGVGSIAVQIAKAKGCYVIGTTSTANVDLVKKLGADEVIDYTTRDFSERLTGLDVVFDTLGGSVLDRSWKVLKKGGILVSIAGNPDPAEAEKYGVRTAYVFVGPSVTILNELRTLIETGKIKPVIDRVYTLDEIRLAHQYSQSGRAKGKIVIEIIK